MLGIKLPRRKRATTFSCMATALNIASTVEFMLTRPEFKVREKLRSGESVTVGTLGEEIWPTNGANFTSTQLWQMGVALNSSFSPQLYPSHFHVEKTKNGSLRATIHPAHVGS